MLSLRDSLQSSTHEGSTRVTHASLRNSASVEFQGKEVLSQWDALHPSTHPSIRWRHCKFLRPTCNFLQMHLQEPEFFWFTSDAFQRDMSCHLETPTWNFYKEIYKQRWYQNRLLIALLEKSHEEYLQASLQADSALTHRHECHRPCYLVGYFSDYR